MDRALLHLVDRAGSSVMPEVEEAIQQAYHWVLRDFPRVDPAMIDDWAEEVAASMQERGGVIKSPKRYAYSALKGRVRDWLRTRTAQEEAKGIGSALERIGGTEASFQESADSRILFEQLKAALNERDRYILVLLLEDKSSPAAVAAALGITYPAAAKAIQRVKERLTEALSRRPKHPGHSSATLCKAKG